MDWRLEISGERDQIAELALFDGRRAYLRVGAGFALLLAVPALPVGILVASAYAAQSRPLQLALGVLLIVAVSASGSIWRRRLWLWPVRARLERWYDFDARQGEVAVNVNETDGAAADRALKRAQLLPKYRRIEMHIEAPVRVEPGRVPAVPREWYIAVVRPSLAPLLAYDDVAARVRDVLTRAGIGARVAGVDVLGGPRGRVERAKQAA